MQCSSKLWPLWCVYKIFSMIIKNSPFICSESISLVIMHVHGQWLCMWLLHESYNLFTDVWWFFYGDQWTCYSDSYYCEQHTMQSSLQKLSKSFASIENYCPCKGCLIITFLQSSVRILENMIKDIINYHRICKNVIKIHINLSQLSVYTRIIHMHGWFVSTNRSILNKITYFFYNGRSFLIPWSTGVAQEGAHGAHPHPH